MGDLETDYCRFGYSGSVLFESLDVICSSSVAIKTPFSCVSGSSIESYKRSSMSCLPTVSSHELKSRLSDLESSYDPSREVVWIWKSAGINTVNNVRSSTTMSQVYSYSLSDDRACPWVSVFLSSSTIPRSCLDRTFDPILDPLISLQMFINLFLDLLIPYPVFHTDGRVVIGVLYKEMVVSVLIYRSLTIPLLPLE